MLSNAFRYLRTERSNDPDMSQQQLPKREPSVTVMGDVPLSMYDDEDQVMARREAVKKTQTSPHLMSGRGRPVVSLNPQTSSGSLGSDKDIRRARSMSLVTANPMQRVSMDSQLSLSHEMSTSSMGSDNFDTLSEAELQNLLLSLANNLLPQDPGNSFDFGNQQPMQQIDQPTPTNSRNLIPPFASNDKPPFPAYSAYAFTPLPNNGQMLAPKTAISLNMSSLGRQTSMMTPISPTKASPLSSARKSASNIRSSVISDKKAHQYASERRYRYELSYRLRQLHYMVPDSVEKYHTFIGIDNIPAMWTQGLFPTNVEVLPSENDTEKASGSIPNKAQILKKTVKYVLYLNASLAVENPTPLTNKKAEKTADSMDQFLNFPSSHHGSSEMLTDSSFVSDLKRRVSEQAVAIKNQSEMIDDLKRQLTI